jgi:hypothetical protein
LLDANSPGGSCLIQILWCYYSVAYLHCTVMICSQTKLSFEISLQMNKYFHICSEASVASKVNEIFNGSKPTRLYTNA